MSLTCGQYEPHISPQNAYFSPVIGVYFVSLFIDHPEIKTQSIFQVSSWCLIQVVTIL